MHLCVGVVVVCFAVCVRVFKYVCVCVCCVGLFMCVGVCVCLCGLVLLIICFV